MADREGLSRREALGLAGLAACGLFGARPVLSRDKSRSRPIPATGELLPVVGLGTWRTFDVGASARQTGRLEEVLSLFARNPGGLIDGSPMYGRSEAVLGEMVARRRLRKSLFLADKVWTEGRQAGIEQMERSFRSLGVDRIDLMQVHNLVDVRTQLPTLLEWKAQGRVRYVGITHYLESADEEVERVLRSQKLDFVQINYSLLERKAGERLLPLAADRGVAVIANRPFAEGELFRRVGKRPLPDWAADVDARSWAQFFLKWILGNPAVTCVIPATDDPRHLEDNLGAGRGELPNERLRQRMADLVGGY